MRGRGRRPKLSVPTKDIGDLDGGVGVAGWRPGPLTDHGLRVEGPRSPAPTDDAADLGGESPVNSELGLPIGDPNPSFPFRFFL
ncbi:hypothetical protein CRG98_035909 [Punica granatum]|uniref:Uncharacterized protein n=1 Tax=Punica granatum TaxID=22663 RepID=A0A2I0IJ24_PUNGR|nr:hypothetical protein CRG98_035909 [Punica granatum]